MANGFGWTLNANRQARYSLCGAEDTGIEKRPEGTLTGSMIA